jgi:hypothetical protein
MRRFRWLVTAATITSPLWAQGSACDLNSDGIVNVTDVQLAINMSIGVTPCTANVYGANVCNIVVVQRVINAALGGSCRTGTTTSPHSVTLSWMASTSSGVVGYNVYRGSVMSGPYTKVTSSLVASLDYTDSTVLAGQTYYYVATAVDGSGNESTYSVDVKAVVPTP